MEFPDLLGDPADSVIDDIIREATQVDPGETSVKSIAKKPKSKRVAYSVACTLHLSGADYQVQLLPSSPEYSKGYRLNKVNAKTPTGYNVMQVGGEIICECSDFRFRQEGGDSKGCKHIRGLVDLGMFTAPSVSYRHGAGIFDG